MRDPFKSPTETETGELDIQPPEFLSNIPAADWNPPVRKPDQRKRQKSRFVQLLPENKVTLDHLADRLRVPRYELIRYLLSYSLSAYRTGQFQLDQQLTSRGLSLYPLQAKRRRGRQTRQLQNTSVRGLPDELWQALKNIAEKQLEVPIWQVLNRFLEYAVAGIENGTLRIQPEAVNGYSLYG